MKKKYKKYTEGWLGSIAYIILGFLIALGFNAFLGFALQTDTPVVAVFSSSMEPTFYKGDMIIVSGDKNISVGDIIVFDVTVKSEPIIHRVYNVTPNGILTKGDNPYTNQHVDPWVIKENDIHGKAILKVPLLGWVRVLITDIPNYFLKR